MNIKKETRTREVVKKVEDEVYVLELNHEEAAALMALVGSLGGRSNEYNPRDHTDRIYAGLKGCGMDDENVKRFARHIVVRPEVG